MKKFLFGMFSFFVVVLSVHSDTYVKISYHCDSYYNYGNLVPAEGKVSEYWFGDKRMAVLTSRARLILDPVKKKLWIVNVSNRMFVEVPLPLDLEKTIDKKVLELFKSDEAGGSVKTTGKTEKILNRKCSGYEKKFWVADQGSQYENRLETIWVTFDLPFDVELYHYLNSVLYDIYHYVAHWDRQLIQDLKKTRGFPMAGYSKLYIKSVMRTAHQEVIEMKERIPTDDIYSIPSGYKKKEKLTLHFFNTFPYHGDWGILDL